MDLQWMLLARHLARLAQQKILREKRNINNLRYSAEQGSDKQTYATEKTQPPPRSHIGELAENFRGCRDTEVATTLHVMLQR
ncbi:hypothetical protein D3C84_580360 [compost metagenome]